MPATRQAQGLAGVEPMILGRLAMLAIHRQPQSPRRDQHPAPARGHGELQGLTVLHPPKGVAGTA